MQVQFETENAGWREPHDPDHVDLGVVADTLRAIADRIDGGELGGIVKDPNGNTCGDWTVGA